MTPDHEAQRTSPEAGERERPNNEETTMSDAAKVLAEVEGQLHNALQHPDLPESVGEVLAEQIGRVTKLRRALS